MDVTATTRGPLDSGADTMSVIDTTKDHVVQTIEAKPWPESSVGYEPDGIAMTKDGHLLVTLGRANAVAVSSGVEARTFHSAVRAWPSSSMVSATTAAAELPALNGQTVVVPDLADVWSRWQSERTAMLRRASLRRPATPASRRARYG